MLCSNLLGSPEVSMKNEKLKWNCNNCFHRSHERLQQHGSNMDTKKSEWHITKMVLAIFVCFLTCYLPITVVKVFDEKVNYPGFHIAGYLLLYMSSCLNPVIYVTMNKQYRQSYLATLKCQFGHREQNSAMHQEPPSRTFMSVVFMQKSPKAVSMNPA